MKIALLVDSLELDYFTNKLYVELTQSEKVSEIIFINQCIKINQSKNIGNIFYRFYDLIRKNGIRHAPYAILYKALITIERNRYKKHIGNAEYQKIFSSYKLSSEKCYVLNAQPIKSRSGLYFRFSKSSIQKIKNLNIDVIIRCGSGIHKGEILSAAKYGVLSFHHGDNTKYRGGPAGFWEVYERARYTGYIIQKINNELDGGDVLGRGEFFTQNYYISNQNELWRKSIVFLVNLIENIAEHGKLPEIEVSVPYSRKLYKYPTTSNLLRYMILVYFRIIYYKFKKVLEFSSKRNYYLLYGQVSNWRSLSFRNLNKCFAPKGHFYADPFVIADMSKQFVFFEDFSDDRKKGDIACMEFLDGKLVNHQTVLSSQHHLSFPFVFSYNGDFFMTPECISSQAVTLYRASCFPFEWEAVEDLLNDVRAADPMIVYKDNKFWLFCNIDSNRGDDFSRELHIYYSEELVGGNWKRHSGNPHINSPFGGRNGGLFKDGDKIFRVGQVSELEVYGKSLVISEVTELSEDKYQEKRIYTPNGFSDQSIEQMHHFSTDNSIVVVDAFGVRGNKQSKS